MSDAAPTVSAGDPPGPPRRANRAALRPALIGLGSTAIAVALIVYLLPRAPGYAEVKATFFDGAEFRASLPEVWDAFTTNIRIFLKAGAVMLVTALMLAIVRSLPGPVFFPVRVLATAYSDLFRGVPTILLVFLLGFGAPALGIEGVPTDPEFWAVLALIIVYTAYVSEVYRAGIDSVHPSQDAAARSLGLSRAQSLRYVVVPQAIRRVLPPLLNDLIGLQKDTALVAPLGVVEGMRQAQINTAATFNFTSYVVAAFLFLLFTVPQTRLLDWLIARDRRRRQTGGAVR